MLALALPLCLLLCLLLCLPLALASRSAQAATPDALDLTGAWYVLVHYTDSATANPDVMRWEDRVWTFEEKGSRLHWTEYPIVIFNDESGRFERVGNNPRSRVLAAWEPDEGQRAEIAQGLQANSRGKQEKALRGSPKRGYESVGKARAASAMTVGYQETWKIESPTTLPVFIQDDVMGTQAALATGDKENFTGRTQYTTEAVSEDGQRISGRFVRDESRKGTFTLIRAGLPRKIESDGRTPNEKARERTAELIRAGIMEEGYKRFVENLRGSAEADDIVDRIGEPKLRALWSTYGEAVAAENQGALRKLGEEVREAYIQAVGDDVATRMMIGDGSYVDALRESGVELTPQEQALATQVEAAFGQERIAALRTKYRERILAGDEAAKRELRKEVSERYREVAGQALMERLERGDAEAIREIREYMRDEQERRPMSQR